MPGFMVFDSSMFHWAMHELGGEHGVDIDPISAVKNPLGALYDQLPTKYKGWIPITKVGQTIEPEKNVQAGETRSAGEVFRDKFQQFKEQQSNRFQSVKRDMQDLKKQVGGRSGTGGGATSSAMNSEDDGLEAITDLSQAAEASHNQLSIDVEVDKSFPKLIRACFLQTEFKEVDVHLATVAGFDLDSLFGAGADQQARANPILGTLLAMGLPNCLPYLSINVKDAVVKNVSYELAASDGVPTTTIKIEFKEVTWTYHVINKSNLNMYNVATHFDFREGIKEKKDGLLGSLPKPF